MTAKEVERLRDCADVEVHEPVFVPTLAAGTGMWLAILSGPLSRYISEAPAIRHGSQPAR